MCPTSDKVMQLFTRLRYCKKNDCYDEAYNLLKDFTFDDTHFPDYWLDMRLYSAREFLAKKEYKKAYQILRQMHIKKRPKNYRITDT